MWCIRLFALDPSLDISQYSHTAWTFRDGFPVGNIFAIAQTSDGYFWLGGEFGLFQFDGVRARRWEPPSGQPLPDRFIFRLLGTHNGALWIGTFSGLVTWDGTNLIRHPEFDGQLVQALVEDHEGTVWVGTRRSGDKVSHVCSIGHRNTQCSGDDGALGEAVWAIHEDRSGTLWVCADSGVWRWRPGPIARVSQKLRNISSLTESKDGRTLMATYGGDVTQLSGDTQNPNPIPYPIVATMRTNADRKLDANKLLWDRNGGLWVGSVEHGLIHASHSRSDTFTKADGLSGDIVLCLFEDREGNVWVSTTGGLDRFREFPVSTVSSKQGLPSDAVASVLADRDGSVWIGTHDGLTRWKNGKTETFRKANGMPGDIVESLFQDLGGRVWVYAGHDLAYFRAGRFVALHHAVPSEDVYSITGDNQGNLWLAGNTGLSRLHDGHFLEQVPWPVLGHSERAKTLVADHGGIWVSFWNEKAVSYFKDGKVQVSYTAAQGLGKGRIADLRLDGDGALWVATDEGGLSRIQNGQVATLSSTNGLPCNMIHWSIEDSHRSLWMYTACGLVRIARSEVEAWIADSRHRVAPAALDSADGVKLRAVSPSSYSPTVARSMDGKLWFMAAEGVQVANPDHLPYNEFPPPVHIEQITADDKPYDAKNGTRLPPHIHYLAIDYTALSLVAPEKMRFRYRLDGVDPDWREVVNDREVQYSNLPPNRYRFRVLACNNSGVWNEEGASIDFVIPPMWYQTYWFLVVCLAAFLAIVWGFYQLRVRQMAYQFNMRLEERVSERTRIARDLHDTLLQSFQALLPRLQAAIILLANRPDQARKTLEEAADQASHAIAEGRDAVHGLRMSTIEKNDLAIAIRTFGEELVSAAAPSSPNFNVVVEGVSRNLHPILRDEVYRLATEALRNAFRHAKAQNVEAEIRYDEKYLRLRIRDDGKGIPPDVVSGVGREGHYGLPGMRERAKLVGGTLTIWTELDGGTEIELNIPGARAYVNSPRPFWYFGKRSATEMDEKEGVERE